MGGVLAAGGVVGAILGVELFRWLRLLGQADLVVALSYLVFLGVIGGLMLSRVAAARSCAAAAASRRRPRRDRRPPWLYGLPLKMRFPRSRLYISVIPPIALGAFVGVLSAIMGVGGGFILVPAMVYVLRMPASVVVGTSLLQIIVTTALTGVLQAGRNQTVDIVLATPAAGRRRRWAPSSGARASSRFRAEELRAVLALIVLLVGLRMGLGLFLRPGRSLRPDVGDGRMIRRRRPAAAGRLRPPAAVSAALTETNVQVNSGFRGARIVLYGAVFDPLARPSDVVVIVRGPEQPVRIARKTRRSLGLWMNSRPVVFQGAPGFYIAASYPPAGRDRRLRGCCAAWAPASTTWRSMRPAEQRIETRYGIRDMVVSRLGSDYLDWRRAVVRLKEKAGLYAVDERGVRFVDKGLFRAEIALPAEAPIGVYQARIVLFQDGQPVSAKLRTLTVDKVGAERGLYLWAHHRPWSYGLAAMAFALRLVGRLAAFRRD